MNPIMEALKRLFLASVPTRLPGQQQKPGQQPDFTPPELEEQFGILEGLKEGGYTVEPHTLPFGRLGTPESAKPGAVSRRIGIGEPGNYPRGGRPSKQFAEFDYETEDLGELFSITPTVKRNEVVMAALKRYIELQKQRERSVGPMAEIDLSAPPMIPEIDISGGR